MCLLNSCKIKYRPKIFTELYRTVLKNIIEQVGYDYNIEIVELEIPVDHIHLVVRSEPQVSPLDIMCKSSKVFQQENPLGFIQECGKLRIQSYFVGTIGNTNEETTSQYVRNQLA
ncbi:IS200/IS605 family transposase [Candidatus Paracaedibacter symbiosus]|uniref:IS200/IS605 family transposase n=1 Tax=Candidatus Paracaedibacter symbiosus TaxID=244582 RepID=UPI00094F1407|nr:IS200/IS605 family transposase [Candidatus Paracaedibacter symbiosus]